MKICKKFLSLLLAVAMTLVLFAPLQAEAAAQTGKINDLDWTYENGVLTISGEGELYLLSEETSAADWSDIESAIAEMDVFSAFRKEITSVVIKKGVTSISGGVFAGCESLVSVSIPSTVKAIDNAAFSNCTSLTKITIPSSVQSIGLASFSGCSSLANIVLPKALTGIGYAAFMGCSSLTDVYYYGTDAEWGNVTIHALNSVLTGIFGSEPQATVHADYVPFEDIVKGAYYYDAVLWAVEEGVTSGMTDTTFAPAGECTRGQVVTFLWRACGSPAPTSDYNPFVDVEAGRFYYDAVLWAVENGVTNGMTDTEFAPNAICTRGQVVTFLNRALGSPAPTTTNNPFTDVEAGRFYYNPVLWAVEEEITNGITATTFAPNSNCNRGQIVTFIYRAMN